jgi:NAD(P)-dependent dehydrogenase (short-subunit alcohol dehydrogenase family)
MKIALITGASRGIGHNTALQLAARGHGVIATYNTGELQAQALVAQIRNAGGEAVTLKLDVSQSATFDHFAGEVERSLKEVWSREHLDFLVNNAVVGGFNPYENVSEDEFDHLMRVHLKGPFFLPQKLLPLLVRGASIVNVTSATTRVATSGVAPYAAMKGGLEVLTRYMAKVIGERGIRVNAVSPGAIRTELGGNALDNNPEFARLLASQTVSSFQRLRRR